MVVAIMDHVFRIHGLAGHDRRVPEAGPAFVHDLGLGLRREIIGFVPDDREHVKLPGLQGGIFENERHDVRRRA